MVGRQIKTLALLLLALLIFCPNMCRAHSGEQHVKDMLSVLNGFGDCSEFQTLCEAITKGMDETAANAAKSGEKALLEGLPCMFEKRFGMGVPLNHRLLGHGWTLNASIPRDTLNLIDSKFIENGLPWRKADVLALWKEWAGNCIALTEKMSKLPHSKARALASLLMDVHLLGDLEPGNALIQYVLSPEEIAKNIEKDLADLLGRNSPCYKRVSQEMDKVIRRALKRGLTNNAKQELAQQLLNILHESNIGSALYEKLGKTLAFDFTEQALRSAGEATAKRLAKQAVRAGEEAVVHKSEQKLTQAAFGKGTAYGRKVAEASLKAAEAGGKTMAASEVVTVAGVVATDGSIWIPAFKTAAWEGGAVFVIDTGIAYYQYCDGAIGKAELKRKLADAAIKGITVGGVSCVAVVLGATPGGWIVLGVGFGAYVITDMALTYYHRQNASKYLTLDDLAAFGITSDTILDIETDTCLQLPIDSPLELKTDSPLDIPYNTPLSL